MTQELQTIGSGQGTNAVAIFCADGTKVGPTPISGLPKRGTTMALLDAPNSLMWVPYRMTSGGLRPAHAPTPELLDAITASLPPESQSRKTPAGPVDESAQDRVIEPGSSKSSVLKNIRALAADIPSGSQTREEQSADVPLVKLGRPPMIPTRKDGSAGAPLIELGPPMAPVSKMVRVRTAVLPQADESDGAPPPKKKPERVVEMEDPIGEDEDGIGAAEVSKADVCGPVERMLKRKDCEKFIVLSSLFYFNGEDKKCHWEGCKVLGKAYRDSEPLMHHVLKHANAFVFVCKADGCDFGSKRRRSTINHISSKHGTFHPLDKVIDEALTEDELSEAFCRCFPEAAKHI